jgi:hypothetical protein
MIDNYECGASSNMNDWQGKRKYSEKPALHITQETWPGFGRGPKPATNGWATARPWDPKDTAQHQKGP